MNFVLEFPGSEVGELVREGAAVRIRLAVAAVRDEAGDRGWLTGVTLEMAAASVEGDTAAAFGRISQAGLRHDARDVAAVDVPGRWRGDVELALALANGTTFVIHGQALETRLAPDSRFTEDFSC
jgi:hypothetical protein